MHQNTLQNITQKLQENGHMKAAAAIHSYSTSIGEKDADRVVICQECVTQLCQSTHSHLIWKVDKPRNKNEFEACCELINMQLLSEENNLLQIMIEFDFTNISYVFLQILQNNEVVDRIKHDIILQ